MLTYSHVVFKMSTISTSMPTDHLIAWCKVKFVLRYFRLLVKQKCTNQPHVFSRGRLCARKTQSRQAGNMDVSRCINNTFIYLGHRLDIWLRTFGAFASWNSTYHGARLSAFCVVEYDLIWLKQFNNALNMTLLIRKRPAHFTNCCVVRIIRKNPDDRLTEMLWLS